MVYKNVFNNSFTLILQHKRQILALFTLSISYSFLQFVDQEAKSCQKSMDHSTKFYGIFFPTAR